MSMYSTISDGIKDAMRNKDRERLAALRDVKSKLMLEATKTGADGNDIPDATVLAILTKLFKQRSETADLYAGARTRRPRSRGTAQAAVIAEFLPQPLTEEEIKAGSGSHHRRDRRREHGRHGQGDGHRLQPHGGQS